MIAPNCSKSVVKSNTLCTSHLPTMSKGGEVTVTFEHFLFERGSDLALITMFLGPENWVWLRLFPVRVLKHGGGAPSLKKNRANGSHQLHELIGAGFQSRLQKCQNLS